MQSAPGTLKKLFSVFATATLLFVSNNIAIAKVSPDSVIEILKLSGMTSLVGQLPKNFKAGIADAAEKNQDIPKELLEAFASATDKSIKSSEILFELAVGITKVMKESELQEMLVWYRSDLGKAITREEELAGTAKAFEIIERDKKYLLDDFQRADFARSIDKISKATDFSIQIQEQVAMAAFTASAAFETPGEFIDPELYRSQVQANLKKQRPQIEDLVIASLIYSHRNIGLRDLIKYEMFLTSDAAIKFSRLTSVSLGAGLEKALQRWAEEVQLELDKVEI